MAEGKDGWAGTIKGRPEQGASAERSRTTKMDVEVDTVRPDKPICQLKVSGTDSAGDVCVEGTATTYTMPLEGL